MFADFMPYRPIQGREAAFVGTPVFGASGDRLGVLAFQILPVQGNAATGAASDTPVDILLVGADGRIRNLPPIPFSRDGRIRAEKSMLPPGGQAGEAGLASSVDVDVFGTAMTLIVKQRLAARMADIASLQAGYLQSLILTASALSLLGILALIFLTAPLRQLRDIAARLARHQQKTSITAPPRKDQIGQVMAALSSLWEDQRKADDLGKSAALVKGAFTHATSPMLILDGENRIMDMNLAMRGFLEQNTEALKAITSGFDPAGVIGQNIAIFGKDFFDQSPETAPFTQVFVLGDRSIMVAASLAPSDLEPAIKRRLLAFSDITETAQTSNIVSQMGAYLAIVEYSPDGRVLKANSVFSAAFGYTPGEITGLHADDLVPKLMRESGDNAVIWQQLRAGQRRVGVFARVSRQGDRLWMHSSFLPLTNASGQVYRIVEIATDISVTEEKRLVKTAEMASIGRVQSLVRLSPDGTILDANQIFLDLVGYELEDLKGKPHRILVPDEVAES